MTSVASRTILLRSRVGNALRQLERLRRDLQRWLVPSTGRYAPARRACAAARRGGGRERRDLRLDGLCRRARGFDAADSRSRGAGLLERAREIGDLLIGKLEALQVRDGRIGDIRGRGAMIAVELVNAETGDPDAALTSRVAAACHADGVVVLTCGTYGNVIRFLPPLAISDELLIDGLAVLAHALELS